MRKFLFLFLVAGCATNFPIQQSPPPGMNAAIQQEVVAKAIEQAVAKLQIEPKASWESTAKVNIVTPFKVYDSGGGGVNAGVLGYLRTMVEAVLVGRGFHVVSGDVEPDWDITIELRTAGAEVKEKDYIVLQEGTLEAVVSFRIYIRNMKEKTKKPYYIAEGSAVSDPYLWRKTILYFIPLPEAKYRPLGERGLWDRFFSLKQDMSAAYTSASSQGAAYAR